MRAVVRDAHGSPDVLRVDEVPRPRLANDAVLIKVEAVGLNAADIEILRGSPGRARPCGT